MTCLACGAPIARDGRSCAMCGYRGDPSGHSWDRRPEAQTYEDLSLRLEEGESLLAATRGKVRGQLGSSLSDSVLGMITPWANMGITGNRLLVQFVKAGTGTPVSEGVCAARLSDIEGIRITDADPLASGRTHRLAIITKNGAQMTLRATGRQGEAAQRLVQVWQALSGQSESDEHTALMCPRCGKPVELGVKYCPYCGTGQGE